MIEIGQVYKLRFENLDEGWESVKVVAAVPQMDEGEPRIWNVQKGDGSFSETREITSEVLLTEAALI